MKTTYLIAAIVIALAISGGAAWGYPDPGLPDTVKIEGGPLIVGQSLPLTFTIINDELIVDYTFPLLLATIDGGFARFDSVVYINRMADPNVLQMRLEVPKDSDGVSPDMFLLGAMKFLGSALDVGNTAVFKIFFTGLEPGIMKLDTVFIPPSNYLNFTYGVPECPTFHPQFQSLQVQVIESRLPPTVTVPETPFQTVVGTEVEFQVAANSSDDSPVELQILTMTGYDDADLEPQAPPTLGSGNPAEFSWTPANDDIGIWQVTFRACDTADVCADRSVIIQTVSSSRFLIPFTMSEMDNPGYALAVTHGDYDNDGSSELVTGGITDPDSSAALFDWTPQGAWELAYCLHYQYMGTLSPQTGYSNPDDYLDLITMSFIDGQQRVVVLTGDGNNSFSLNGLSNDGTATRSLTLGEFTGDQYLDAAATWYDGIHIFAGNGYDGYSQAVTVSTGDSALSVNSADFDGDGREDLAVGTVAGIGIYLANTQGGFTLTDSYIQEYGSKEIEVTNRGSDFNNDDIFDLCISTPSIGGAFSQMVLYLGVGDGSFTQHVIRTVRGQIYGNCVGDFDGDGNLDIGYVNGARRYFAILFGNGDGSFSNELRWNIPDHTPQVVDCYDIDLDGDPDVIVAANARSDISSNNAVFTLLSQRNPRGFEKRSVTFTGRDNTSLELVSASGKVFNHVRNTMPSGNYFRRNLDENGAIDDYAAMGVVESGRHTLTATPRPNRPAGEPFTLEFTLDGQPFRLAKDVPMNETGYEFTVFPGDGSTILPRPGAFVEVNPPSFTWSGSGDFDFQLATDIDFTDLVANTVVSGSSFTLPAPLVFTDTVTCYWRVKAHGARAFADRYVINMVPSSGIFGDVNGDGSVDLGDAVFLVIYIFKDGQAPSPVESGDTNCDGTINIGDAVHVINYVFKGGAAPGCL